MDQETADRKIKPFWGVNDSFHCYTCALIMFICTALYCFARIVHAFEIELKIDAMYLSVILYCVMETAKFVFFFS